ncbi:MAG: hypothetical protein HOI95_10350 [Chromatiales bacterium]|nr:hypothetical protein [Chromatiales bacterium]
MPEFLHRTRLARSTLHRVITDDDFPRRSSTALYRWGGQRRRTPMDKPETSTQLSARHAHKLLQADFR